MSREQYQYLAMVLARMEPQRRDHPNNPSYKRTHKLWEDVVDVMSQTCVLFLEGLSLAEQNSPAVELVDEFCETAGYNPYVISPRGH